MTCDERACEILRVHSLHDVGDETALEECEALIGNDIERVAIAVAYYSFKEY